MQRIDAATFIDPQTAAWLETYGQALRDNTAEVREGNNAAIAEALATKVSMHYGFDRLIERAERICLSPFPFRPYIDIILDPERVSFEIEGVLHMDGVCHNLAYLLSQYIIAITIHDCNRPIAQPISYHDKTGFTHVRATITRTDLAAPLSPEQVEVNSVFQQYQPDASANAHPNRRGGIKYKGGKAYIRTGGTLVLNYDIDRETERKILIPSLGCNCAMIGEAPNGRPLMIGIQRGARYVYIYITDDCGNGALIFAQRNGDSHTNTLRMFGDEEAAETQACVRYAELIRSKLTFTR